MVEATPACVAAFDFAGAALPDATFFATDFAATAGFATFLTAGLAATLATGFFGAGFAAGFFATGFPAFGATLAAVRFTFFAGAFAAGRAAGFAAFMPCAGAVDFFAVFAADLRTG